MKKNKICELLQKDNLNYKLNAYTYLVEIIDKYHPQCKMCNLYEEVADKYFISKTNLMAQIRLLLKNQNNKPANYIKNIYIKLNDKGV